MIRRTLSLAALAGGGLLLSAAAPADAAAAACKNLKPAGVQLDRGAGGDTVKVRWRKPRNAPGNLAFRVSRDGAVVGQTGGRSMDVRLADGRAAELAITAVVGSKLTSCRATVRVPAGARLGRPGQITDLAVRPRGDRRARLTWGPAERGTYAVKRYRVKRGKRVVKTTRKRGLTVRATKRARTYRVFAVDRSGGKGPLSNKVRVKRGLAAPSTPEAVAASDVNETSAALSWAESRAFGTNVAKYRIVRGKRTLASVMGTSARVGELENGKEYAFRVVAVDKRGWASKRSEKVTLVTGHRAPAAPGAPTPMAVADTSVTLGWSPSGLPTGSQLRGYRVMRDGQVVQQVPAQQVTVGNLAPKAAHDWTIAAVDTRGYASAPSPATRVVQSPPPPTAGGVHAFLLASTDSSFAAFRKHYRKIGVVYPTFYDCNRTTGAIVGQNNAQIVSYAQDRKVRVLPRFNCQSGATLHKIFTEPELREHWLDAITQSAVQNGWDGVNIDFEAGYAEDRNLMTSFIAELSDRLHANGKLLSQAVSAKFADSLTHPRSGAFDYPELAKYNDWVFVMAWGVHWATSTPGAQDDFEWVRKIRDYVATMPYQEKFVMGTMLYGMDWPNGGGAENPGTALHWPEIAALIAQRGVTPQFDAAKNSYRVNYTDEAGAPHELWYSDAQAIGDRIGLAREAGLKVGVWRLGQEDERIWSDPRLPTGN